MTTPEREDKGVDEEFLTQSKYWSIDIRNLRGMGGMGRMGGLEGLGGMDGLEGEEANSGEKKEEAQAPALAPTTGDVKIVDKGVDEEEFLRQSKYWSQVAKSDGFDLDNVTTCGYIQGLREFDCQSRFFYPFRNLVKGFAKLGLHRYNMLQGTIYEFRELVKYNMLMTCLSSFYITFHAYDPISELDKTFQVRVDESQYNNLDITVSVARPKGEVVPKTRFRPHFHLGANPTDDFFKGPLPDWPSSYDLKDQTRFYTLNSLELHTIKWVRLYFELVICGHKKETSDSHLSGLEIVKVAIETKKDDGMPPQERLKAKSAYLYITFKGWDMPPSRFARDGKHGLRRAIIRRVLNVDTEYMTLVGKVCQEERKRTQQANSD
ncbi:unnamed protein product [Cochlearia groenlandica]